LEEGEGLVGGYLGRILDADFIGLAYDLYDFSLGRVTAECKFGSLNRIFFL